MTGQGTNKPVSDALFHDESPEAALTEVARFPRLQTAREYGLVIAAMERPHWIKRQGREYVLCVEPADRVARRDGGAEAGQGISRPGRDGPRQSSELCRTL